MRYGLFAAIVLFAPGCTSSEVSRSLGAQCDSRSECEERCETGGDYPEGICTTACEKDSDCPLNARCVDKEGGICLFSCDVDIDCEFLGSGWVCKDKDRRQNTEEEVQVCFGS